MLAVFGPNTPGAVMSPKETPGRQDVDGSVTTRTRVVIGVAPRQKQARPPGHPLHPRRHRQRHLPLHRRRPQPHRRRLRAEAHDLRRAPLGAVKFLANGTVLTSNGGEGTWKLFDAASGIDTVTVAGRRLTLTLERGRGLVDTAHKLTVFEMQR